MNWIGLDIGGANLKAADGRGWARSVPFALWRNAAALPAAIAELTASAPSCDRVAVTMTGELCDCFRTKEEGVRCILDAVRAAATNMPVAVYLVDGRLVSADEASSMPALAAASNWHVLAQFAATLAGDDTALLLDVGSTTTDIVPIVAGRPQAVGSSDTARLQSGELVYTGVGRTPICALTNALPWRGSNCPVAAELFATTADAYVLLGQIEEQASNLNTADGRPLSREFARERLARMVCADRTTFSEDDARQAALYIQEQQSQQVGRAIRQVVDRLGREPRTVVLSGAGEWFARHLAQAWLPQSKIISISQQIGPEASACAPAHALAVLASTASSNAWRPTRR